MAKRQKESDLVGLSDDEFMERWTSLGNDIEEAKARLREYSHEHQRRVRKQQLLDAMGGLSESDIALLQEASAEGIVSEEEVN